MTKPKQEQQIEELKKWYHDKNGDVSTIDCFKKALALGYQNAKDEDIEIIKDLENPYPSDVFIEPTKEQWRKVSELFEENGFVQDKYFGSIGRLVFNNIRKELIKKIKGEK